MIDYRDNTLEIDGATHVLDYPIEDAREVDDLIIVLFAFVEKVVPSRIDNLIALDRQGQQVWAAEFPTSYSHDRYWEIKTVDPLVAYTFSSWECTICKSTGRILSRIFHK